MSGPDDDSGDAGSAQAGRLEGMTLAAFGAVLIVLRVIALFHYRPNADESQHLHVAWGWSEGLMQYRDVFDNHTPLLHLLSAPLVAFLGERPDIVICMRAAMLPLFVATLLSTFFIARRLYSPRIAWWSVIVVAAYPRFFLKSLEYRTDNLWTALWMLALALLLAGRCVLAAFVLGGAVCASMKTLPLVLALLVAGLVTHFPLLRGRPLVPLVRRAVAAVAAFLAVPLALGAFFYLRGAWRPMVYGVFEFNLLATRARPHPAFVKPLYPVCLLLIVVLAVRLSRRVDRNRLLPGLLLATYVLTTQTFWPILSQRDYLAVMPLFAMFIAAGCSSPRVLTALTLVFVASLFHDADMFRDRTGEQIALVRQTLSMTRPGDCVMDLKGETLYRRRPFFYALETITRSAIGRGLIADTIAEDVIAHRCHVAAADSFFFPPRARAFLNANFIDVGLLRASGQWIADDGSFSVAIPGRYVIAARNGLARGLLDGVPFTGAVVLNAGPHRFVRTTPGERVAYLWADAFERGYSPFTAGGTTPHPARRLVF